MATLFQLQGESEWNDELAAPALATLARQLRTALHVPDDAVGIRGDINHLRGYHRSAAWVHRSAFCTDRSYSVSETPGNRSPGDVNWVCALDVGGLPQDKLIAMCQRVDAAVRSGRFEKITEWYGNINGDQHVDGYDNIRNVLATSDSSHLVHLHLSFDRGRANEDHSDVFAILMGDDMPTAEELWSHDIDSSTNNYTAAGALLDTTRRVGDLYNRVIPGIVQSFQALSAKLETLSQAVAAISIALTPEQLASLSDAAKTGAESALDGVTVTTKIDKAP